MDDSSAKKSAKTLDINEVMDCLPHRYPMLMIDKIADIVPGENATAIKNVTVNEPFFQGHFPGHPIMPGVFIIEAMAQTAAVVVVRNLGKIDPKRYVVYFMTIDEARFRRPVLPGDTLRIVVSKDRQRGNVWRFKGVAYVGNDKAAEANFSAMLIDTHTDKIPK
jgi:3-hydroxyacyl-[acyl-carrier-protein] dehydratase